MDSKEKARLLRLLKAKSITTQIWNVEISRLAGLQGQLLAIRKLEFKLLDRLHNCDGSEIFTVARLQKIREQRMMLMQQIEQQKYVVQRSGLRAKSVERFYEKIRQRRY